MNHIDTIYYINLEHRTDRNGEFLECMSDLQVPSEKIERINGIYEPKFGALGCTKSHILALETFISSGKDICMVFEDDFMYKDKETFWPDISKIFDTGLNFDLVQLSYNNYYKADLFYQVLDTEYPFLKKVLKTISSSSYIITKEFASILLENFKESSQLLQTHGFANDKAYVLDIYWHSLQSKTNWYIIVPSIGYQRGSYSDVCYMNIDYAT